MESMHIRKIYSTTKVVNVLISTTIAILLALLFVPTVFASLSDNATNQQIINYACDQLRQEGSQIYNQCVQNTRQRLEYCSSLSDPGDRSLCRQSYISGLRQGQNQSIDGLRQETERLRAERNIQEIAVGDTQGDCSESLHPNDCGIMAYIRILTDGLTVIVGVVVTGMLVFGGIQYSAAGSNPQVVQAAKKHISQALLALAIWIFMAAFLQWLIPGGIF